MIVRCSSKFDPCTVIFAWISERSLLQASGASRRPPESDQECWPHQGCQRTKVQQAARQLWDAHDCLRIPAGRESRSAQPYTNHGLATHSS